MINRLFVVPIVPDARADVRTNKIGKEVFLVDIYTIKKQLSADQLKKIGAMLTNPVTQQVHFNTFPSLQFFFGSFEIGFLPGVTDNVAVTTREMIEDVLHVKFDQYEGIYTSQITCITDKGTKKDIERIAGNFMNPLIHRIVMDKETFIPSVRLMGIPHADHVCLNVSDEELEDIGKQGILNDTKTRRGPLALDLPSMKSIQIHFQKIGRNPTDVELESIAQTWSEHCKHTIFNSSIDDIPEGLFRRYIKGATDKIRKKKGDKDICVRVFSDNSGAILFDNTYLITHKVETHNSPSALDPFGGAVTGIVGVNRDCIGFGLGAKPIANTYGFCVADPDDSEPLYRDRERMQQMLPPKRILEGVVAGVNSGGNCSGIPTPQGFIYFDHRYKGKPLVFVGTVGLLPIKKGKRLLYKKRANCGDYIVMLGGRVGLDGIHGATFSSEALNIKSPATAVQIGDPITQKKFSDVLIKEARDHGLYTSITDNGAGGLSCSVAEMAKESGGCLVDLKKIPVKYPGLTPWQLWISESQERMTLAVAPRKWRHLHSLFARRGVEATVIGMFTKSGRCIVTYGKKIVMDLSMHFLHNGQPKKYLKSAWKQTKNKELPVMYTKNYTETLFNILKRPNLAGFAWISTQFDHEVQGTSVVKPIQGAGRVNADTTVIRPVLSSCRGIVLSQGLYPSYGDIDPYDMAAASVDTAVRNVVVAGANVDSIAILDNFCWCSSADPFRLGQLKRAVMACYDIATFYRIPFISGKDSMHNDFVGFDSRGKPSTISIPPTLLISALGIISDIQTAVTMDIKVPGDLVYVLGDTQEELGGSEYAMFLCDSTGRGGIGNHVPKVDAGKNIKLYRRLAHAIRKELVASTQSVTRGGLIMALAKSAIAGQLGLDISLQRITGSVVRDDQTLFSESQGRALVTVCPKKQRKFEQLMQGIAIQQIGVVTTDPTVKIKGLMGKPIVQCSVKELSEAYRSMFAGY